MSTCLQGANRMRLSDREWKTFIIGDLFSVKRPIARNKDHYENGNVPFVASGSGNNGVMKCCKPHKNEELDNAGCITVSPVDGSAFYQPYDFLGRGGAGSSILMLYADNINLYNGQFIAKMIANTCACKYTYGHMGNKDSIKRERIMLPVDDNDEPDYQFMEDYMKELMAAKRKQYQEYVEQRLVKLGIDDVENTKRGGYNLDLESKEWNPCRLSKLGKVESGRDIYAMERVEGDIPYITSGSQNNGIGYFVSNKNDTLDKGYISFNRNGAVGLAFYHSYWSVMGNDCRKIHISNADKNIYVGLFIATAISMQSKLFSYSRKLGTARANKLQVMLPVDDNNEPDYELMEECGRKMMAKKYIQYLKYLESTCESSDLLLK